jgi:hypothetical protein
MCGSKEDSISLEAYRVARETRNLEINLFWQRSNYFLVLSTAIAVGFFSRQSDKYAPTLAAFGVVVGALWISVNLGGKFWQSRWEQRLRIVEEQLHPDLNLFSASWETAQDDVRNSFQFRKRGRVYRVYSRLVLLKPSVSFAMTALSFAFLLFWVALIATMLFSPHGT